MTGDDYGAESGAPGLPAAPRPGPAPSRGAGGESASATAAPAAGIQNPLPAISLPKGGGAIRGIGEKFAANPVTGTGSMSVPIATSPGRSGFGPQLALSHDSGSGNGPFGVGWSLSTPAVSRKTDKGLPLYRDFEESDVFLLSGAEDLVPVRRDDGSRFVDEKTFPGYVVHRYRPRTEGLFARIERWSHLDSGEVHWRSISRDNVTTLYGKTAESRIADPDDPRRVFTWLICQSYDDKGNAIIYDYVGEDDANVNRFQANERNRVRTANRYLKRIRYGNRVSRLIEPDLGGAEWLFEVVFDYGEGHSQDLPLDPSVHEDAQHRYVRASHAAADSWPVRPDPFSSYRSGFEVRSYRRCHRVLMFHRFEELGQTPCLVRSTDFHYRDLDLSEAVAIDDELAHQGSTRFASLLRSVTQSGYVRQKDDEARYLKKSLPPVELEYSKARIRDEVRELDPSSLENLPIGLDGADYQWVDLDGEGISGILTEQAGEWFYKRNLGAGRFAPQELVPTRPSMAALGGGRQQLLDLAGDGQLDLVALADPAPGFYERTADGGWEPFRSIPYLPNVRWDDPNLRFVDLTGDGHADLLITEDDVFTWYPSLAEDGFGPARRASRPQEDEQRGARLVMADGTQSIYLADMGGDGLNDLVRIRNGEVCYWPNTGYGRFGAKVTMDNGPWLDHPEVFNHERIRLADIDGSGTNDLIYLAPGGARIYFNQSGNRFSEARRLRAFPHTDHLASVTTADLLGNGTACLVWSSPLTGDVGRPLRYIDLMGGEKPHLLVNSKNNLGAETLVRYAPSTRFYLADKAAGKPWITKIPFPVHVVERVETYDRISGNRFVTRYAYHHGYFDGVEREFRGFGLVEQWDTEEFAALNAGGAFPTGTNIDESSHVPPVLTRTWFHTGVYLGRDRVSNFFAGLLDANDKGEYFREPGLSYDEARALLLDDTVLPDGLSFDEAREACRALRGSMLRQEVYARDGSAKEPFPYAVTEQNFTIKVLQPKRESRHGVFFTHAREALSYHYERNPDDPRTTHALTLEVDDFGDVLKSASVGYGRRKPDTALEPRDQAMQAKVWTTYTENAFTNAVEERDAQRAPLAAEARTFELTGLRAVTDKERFALQEMILAGRAAATLSYEEEPTSGKLERRLIEHARTLYRSDNLERTLPLGRVESLALPFESYKLALTPGLITKVFGDRVTDSMLEKDGGYVHSNDANWWVPSGRVFRSPDPGADAASELAFAREHFFLPHRFRDPFHTPELSTEAFVAYDRYDVLLQETRDARDNRITVGERSSDRAQPPVRRGQDYRVLQPTQVMDPNRNRSEVVFDALGMVVGTAVMGKPEEDPVPGDRITTAFPVNLTRAQLTQFLAAPRGPIAAQLLHDASTCIIYDLDTQPTFAATLARETHARDPLPEGGLRVQVSFSYSDGFGRELQKKIPAEPGPVTGGDPAPEVNPRWVGTGWTVFNNKGKPVRQYEPFFTATHSFEFNAAVGVSPILSYDAVDRVVATVHPNHTWDKVVFNAWLRATWDVNDTILASDPSEDPDAGEFLSRLPASDLLPTWYAQREGGAMGKHEQIAARKTTVHAGTPTAVQADSLGRTVLTIAHNRIRYSNTPAEEPPHDEFHKTRVVLDIQGNQRGLIDAKDRLVMRYDYDLLGSRLYQASMEAGERRALSNVAGRAVYSWDSRQHRFRTEYDALQRPTYSFLMDGSASEVTIGRTVYGESSPRPEANNLRRQIVRIDDQSGAITTDSYDFKGNLLQNARQLAHEYKATIDWSVEVPLEPEVYVSGTTYDALNRPVEKTSPDGSIVRQAYSEANFIEQIEANLRGAQRDGQRVWTPVVTDLDYDARGQRLRIDYANGVRTTYTYDPFTFRLTSLMTRRDAALFPRDCLAEPSRDWSGCAIQNLSYTYDPVGNITSIADAAQQTIFFRNRRVDPGNDYNYDATYRLLEATGREHVGQVGTPMRPYSWDDLARGRLPHPHDGNAMVRYRECYTYDAVGNILQIEHRGAHAAAPGWTRTLVYVESSLLEPDIASNRLSYTAIGDEKETLSNEYDGYDAHGNMLHPPHLTAMSWDHRDRLHMVSRQSVTAEEPSQEHQGQNTWYTYGQDGQRIRKLSSNAAQKSDRRLYLEDLELFHRNDGSSCNTLHIRAGDLRIAFVDTRVDAQGSPDESQRIYFNHANHLKSISLVLDDRGQLVSYEEYTPYGNTSFQLLAGAADVRTHYRYAGKEKDEESGFHYFGGRYYATWLGRWTSCDPSGVADGPNTYRYAADNPITFTDASGNAAAPLGSHLGRQALESYADLIIEGEHQGGLGGALTQGVGYVGGFFAALWTPETATQTGIVLATGGAAALAGPIAPALLSAPATSAIAAAPAPVAFAVVASYDTGVSAVQAISGKSTGAHSVALVEGAITGNPDVGRTLSKTERVFEGAGAALGAVSLAGSVRQARSQGGTGAPAPAKPDPSAESPQPARASATTEPESPTRVQDAPEQAPAARGRTPAETPSEGLRQPLDPTPYPRHSSSRVLGPEAPPGDYVYVRDAEGMIHIAESGPHMHPKVLGGGQPATGAGTIRIGPGGEVLEVTNYSGTFQHGAESMPSVVQSIEAQGLQVSQDAVRTLHWEH